MHDLLVDRDARGRRKPAIALEGRRGALAVDIRLDVLVDLRASTSPGERSRAERSTTPARMCPARRMSAISRADLSTITARLPWRPGSSRESSRAAPRRTPSPAGCAGGSSPERRRLALMHVQALAYRGLGVVVALIELTAALVTHARALRGIRRDVVRMAARAADAASGQTSQQLRLGHVEVERPCRAPGRDPSAASPALRPGRSSAEIRRG